MMDDGKRDGSGEANGGQEDGGKDDDDIDDDEDFLDAMLRHSAVELLMETTKGLDNLRMLMKARKEHMYMSQKVVVRYDSECNRNFNDLFAYLLYDYEHLLLCSYT